MGTGALGSAVVWFLGGIRRFVLPLDAFCVSPLSGVKQSSPKTSQLNRGWTNALVPSSGSLRENWSGKSTADVFLCKERRAEFAERSPGRSRGLSVFSRAGKPQICCVRYRGHFQFHREVRRAFHFLGHTACFGQSACVSLGRCGGPQSGFVGYVRWKRAEMAWVGGDESVLVGP